MGVMSMDVFEGDDDRGGWLTPDATIHTTNPPRTINLHKGVDIEKISMKALFKSYDEG